MSKLSKRVRKIREKFVFGKQYSVEEALQILKDCPSLAFVEGVDVSVNLGADPRKSEQSVRGSVILPHGTGRKIRVAVFAEGEQAAKAIEAGADLVGYEDLAQEIKQGNIDFDLLIATPDSMRLVGQLGQILGPRGLMPNPKVGTVAADVSSAVKNAKSGQVQYKMDKGGVVHCPIGKINFEVHALKENLLALIADLKRIKPSAVKGVYLRKLVLSSTMGPGLIIDLTSLGV